MLAVRPRTANQTTFTCPINNGRNSHEDSLILTIALALAAPARAQEVTVRVHHFLSADAPIQKGVLEPWEKTVEVQSGGRIDVQI